LLNDRELMMTLNAGDSLMKRFVRCAVGAFVAAGLIGVVGCDSGGIDTGVPTDTKAQIPLQDMNKQLIPITPPGTKAKKEDKSATAPTAEASKETKK
jgi:hypothetical protein